MVEIRGVHFGSGGTSAPMLPPPLLPQELQRSGAQGAKLQRLVLANMADPARRRLPDSFVFRQEAADAVDATRGPSFAADQDESPQRGSGRPIPPLVSKIQVATTNAGARAQGGLTPDFLALSALPPIRFWDVPPS
jgi:hypothetical protein